MQYDAHHIMKNLQLKPDETLEVIPHTEETYIAFDIRLVAGHFKRPQKAQQGSTAQQQKLVPQYERIRFLDSYRFLGQGLAALANNLNECDFKCVTAAFSQHYSQDQISLLKRKGIFPYSYFNDFEKLNETKLPDYGPSWKNSLTNSIDTSIDDYQHALSVWRSFNCKRLQDYLHLYLECDVMLLADVFQRFRSVCLQYYKLDPLHFYTAPNLSWEAMLKITGAKVELLADVDQLLFCESAIRGGVNGVGELRLFTANNDLCPEFQESEEKTFGAFFDVTSMYAGTMTKPLPIGGFKWVTDSVTLEQILSTPADSAVGFYVEVDLRYPEDLHDIHNDFPLAPEKRVVETKWLSSYQHATIVGKMNPGKVPKLLETLWDKSHYTCHYENLKFYHSQGLEIVKLHRVLQFEQKCWMRPYIDLNTKRRKAAKDDFEKSFYKLMSNAVFGKTMENLRNRITIQMVREENEAQKLTKKFTFKKFTIFTPNLTAVTLRNSSVFWNKPTYVGAAILELSKLVLYRFHYEQMKQFYGERIKLLYKDTDSLVYKIVANNFYEDMRNFAHLLDLSEYPRDHFLYDPTNKKVPLTMKDELSGKALYEVVALRAKLYSLKFASGEKSSAKGVTKSVKKTLNHDLFKNVLTTATHIRKRMRTLTSDKHEIVITEVNKLALTAFDDKRHILEDGITTVAHGHYKIRSGDNNETTTTTSSDHDCLITGSSSSSIDHQQKKSPTTTTTEDSHESDEEVTTDSADDTTDNDCSPSSSSRNVLSGPAHDDSLTSTTPQRFVPPDPGLYQTDHDSDYDESEILKMNQLGVDQQQQDDDEEFCSPSKRRRLHTRSSNNPFILYEAEEASASSIEDGDNDEEEEEEETFLLQHCQQ